MAENKIFRVYEELPQWAKGVVVVGGLAVTFIVGNTIYKRINAFSDSADAQNKLRQLEDDLNNKLKSKIPANALFPLNQIIVKNGNFWPEKSAYTV